MLTNEDASRGDLEDKRVCFLFPGVPGSRLGLAAFR